MLYAHCDNIHPIFRQSILVFDQYQFVFDLGCKNKHEVNGKTGLITDSKHVCGDTNNIT